MKFITKFFLLALIVGFVACDAELDLQDNPNEVTPDKASVGDLYNSIQLTFGSLYQNVQGVGGRMTRMYHMGNFTYEAHTQPSTFDGAWFNTYSNLFPDIDALLALTEARGLDIHSGSVKIMKAYALMALVDNLNDIPLTEAGQGTDIISPQRDGGASVYAAANALLDEAISLLNSTSATGPSNDFYYGGDAAKWSALANTLKLRSAVTTRLIDPSGAASTISSVIGSGNYIKDADGDFQVNFGNNRLNPNSRHPLYNGAYENAFGGYQSNYYMWLLDEGYMDADELIISDPRVRYYFYRQNDETIGLDPTLYSCHFSTLPEDPDGYPSHYSTADPRMPYCVATLDGYYGRDHGNGEGTPPDGPVRTVPGLYPAGGVYDDNSFNTVNNLGTDGALGQGIFPIMLSSFVDFMRAESALTAGTGEDARALLESGIRKSIAKVQSFEPLVAAQLDATRDIRGELVPIRDAFVPDEAEIEEFISFVLAKYDNANADGKLDVVMTEYYKALWGNGLESFNMYRRTGKPGNMQPTLEAAGGNFSRSFFYPAVHVNRNANANQRDSRTELVFWDDGSAPVY